MNIEDVAGERLTARRTPEQQGKLTIRAGVVPLKPQISEVAELFGVPLTALRDPKFRGDYEWKSDGPAGRSSKFPAILYGGQVIWGLTLRITLNLIELLDPAPFSSNSSL